MIQTPQPGSHHLKFRGDTVTFELLLPFPEAGHAWLRTNIGHAKIARTEIVHSIELNTPILGRDWFDIAMLKVDERRFRITLPLCQTGHFQGKCYFIKENDAAPAWPAGENVVINVEPADTCCANIIYNAFVRQFGRTKSLDRSNQKHITESVIQDLDDLGYTVIPPSGTFRDLVRELDFIMGTLGCRILHLLPIHPTPTTYAKMGRFGSPYAALSFKAVDPALAQFDPAATPLEQFLELVDAIHGRQGKLILDMAINHTGWAASLHESHPQWLVRDENGRIENPGAWGVLWGDLTRLDYSQKDLWKFMADIFLLWCKRGVDGYRCDAGYMIPVPAWQYIISVVREQFPDTLFFLEGLGGKISVTRDILNMGNFNWAYSELFQNYDRAQIEHYLHGAYQISREDGIMVHFAETHDNNRLAEVSPAYAALRTALCALFSVNGGFGFANGVEWFATEKIIVHEAKSLNWGAEENQVKQIERLTRILTRHPAFFDQTALTLIGHGPGNFLVLLRHHPSSGKKLVIVVNLELSDRVVASFDVDKTGLDQEAFLDLLTGRVRRLDRDHSAAKVTLEPAEILCLSPDMADTALLDASDHARPALPHRIRHQRFAAKVLEILTVHGGIRDVGGLDLAAAVSALDQDPVAFLRSHNSLGEESRVIPYVYPRDIHREVMIPPGYFLLVESPYPFRAAIQDTRQDAQPIIFTEEGLVRTCGRYFVLCCPLETPLTDHTRMRLRLSVYENDRSRHVDGTLCFLTEAENVLVKKEFARQDIQDKNVLFLGTNNRGGMLRGPIHWGHLNTKYDAFLSANLSPSFPVDRWVMVTRIRGWVVFQGYSQEINFDCFHSFTNDDTKTGYYRFHMPVGQGQHVLLTLGLEMVPFENGVRLFFYRHPCRQLSDRLNDQNPIQVILRPDIDSRNFHHLTKAYSGPETHFPASVSLKSEGFDFCPSPHHRLRVTMAESRFVAEKEWHYMAYMAQEVERGMDGHTDLFSPGYFSLWLAGNGTAELVAQCHSPEDDIDLSKDTVPLSAGEIIKKIRSAPFGKRERLEPLDAMKKALFAYVARRGDGKTVIAGYPWFLDWGRDALIFVRGLIAAGHHRVARSVIRQFGRFEENGTLPNMINGNDAGNRDTVDAALWLFVAVADLIDAEHSDEFLEERVGSRTMRQVLIDLAASLIDGTKNNIRVDDHSGLMYSPPHFTWMDTDFPAGSPREGYCIEIQALWYGALLFLTRIDEGNSASWQDMATKVKTSVFTYFVNDKGGLVDCLHADSKTPAHKALADDALRPNQLFALTTGVVTDPGTARTVLDACETLVVPGAIRSLSNDPVTVPIPVTLNGHLLNDPYHPYQGVYAGDEDTQRKPAYHNGTAWTWVFPTFCEAWARVYGQSGKKTALAYLASGVDLLHQGCIGHFPEILDGDAPHTPRGCDAQAWAMSEYYRVWKRLLMAS